MTTEAIPIPNGTIPAPRTQWWKAPGRQWRALREQREDQVFLVLTLVIGALVGLVVVAFIVITERFGARLYPAGGAPWRRLLVPVLGSLGMGYLLYRFFPMREAAECRKRRRLCGRGAGEFLPERYLESSSALQRRWPAEYR